MAKVLYKINNKTEKNNSNTQMMMVFDALNGEALSLSSHEGNFNENEIHTDIIHASSVPYLVVGDRVIVQKISDEIIITDRLRKTGEKPTVGFEINEDGSLSLYSDISIMLKALDSKIDILNNGKILIDGREIYSRSKGINRIQGTSIELN